MRTQQARVHSSSFLQGIIRSSLFIRAASLFTTDKEIIDDQTRIMRAPRKGVEPTDLLAVLQEPCLFKQVLMRAEGKFNTQMVTLEEGSKSSEEEGLGSPCPPLFEDQLQVQIQAGRQWFYGQQPYPLLSNKSSRQSVHQAHQAKTGTAEGKRLVHHGQCALLCQSRPCVLLSRLGFQKSWPPVLPEIGLLSSTGDV